MTTVKGYKVVQVPLPNVAGSFRQLFMKEHADREGEGAGRTLFVCNIDDGGGALPDNLVQLSLQHMFEQFGDIEDVSIGELHRGEGGAAIRAVAGRARFARIRFEEPRSLRKALAADQITPVDPETLQQESRSHRGYSGMLMRYKGSRPPRQQLQAEVDKYMAVFEEQESADMLERKRRATEVDEDGFTVVTYKKKRGRPEEGQAAPEGRKRQKKQYELQNFYRFQMREAKREQLVKLRAKFEEDKARITRMKEARKFRPF